VPIDFLIDYNDPTRQEWPTYEWKTGGWRQRQVYQTITPTNHQGKMVKAFEVEPGDVLSGASGERAEGRWDGSDEHLMDGNGVWKYYAWACFVPEDWASPGGFAHPYQWHNTASFSQPPIKFDFDHNSVESITVSFNTGLESGGTWTYNQRHDLYSSLSKGVRQNFIIGALWDRTANGAFKVWHCVEGTDSDFVLRLDLSSIPTLTYLSPANVGNIYLKNGLYTTAADFTRTIYHYLSARGDSYAEMRSLFKIPRVLNQKSVVDAHLDVAVPGSPASYPGLVYPNYTPSFERDTLTGTSSSKGTLTPTTSTKGTLS